MRVIFLFLILFYASSATAQNKHDVIIDQFTRLKGDWDGYMEYTDMYDNKTKFSMPAACQTTFNGKKWEYAVQYDEGNGEMTGGKGECTINAEGTKMNYDGIIWEVTKADVTGDTAVIILETSGKENRKKVNLRRTMMVSTYNFSILEEVNTIEEGPSYIVRNKHIFRRKESQNKK